MSLAFGALTQFRQLGWPHDLGLTQARRSRSSTSWAIRQNPPQKDDIDATSKANSAVNFDDGDAGGESFAEFGRVVDIDALGMQSVLPEQVLRLVAQVTTLSRVENDTVFVHGNSFHRVFASPKGWRSGPAIRSTTVVTLPNLSASGIFLPRVLLLGQRRLN